MSDSTVNFKLLRHALATIRHRADKTLSNSTEGFEGFELGNGVRIPAHHLDHIGEVLIYAAKNLDPKMTQLPEGRDKSWKARIVLFHQIIESLDHAFSDNIEVLEESVYRLLQGPIADAMTHIGQLAMLRRCAASPVERENHYQAHIKSIDRSRS